MHYARFESQQAVDDLNSYQLEWVLAVFAVALLLGAGVAWAWAPDVQTRARTDRLALQNLTLEALAKEGGNVWGRDVAYGFRQKGGATWARLTARRRR